MLEIKLSICSGLLIKMIEIIFKAQVLRAIELFKSWHSKRILSINFFDKNTSDDWIMFKRLLWIWNNWTEKEKLVDLDLMSFPSNWSPFWFCCSLAIKWLLRSIRTWICDTFGRLTTIETTGESFPMIFRVTSNSFRTGNQVSEYFALLNTFAVNWSFLFNSFFDSFVPFWFAFAVSVLVLEKLRSMRYKTLDVVNEKSYSHKKESVFVRSDLLDSVAFGALSNSIFHIEDPPMSAFFLEDRNLAHRDFAFSFCLTSL